MQIVGYVNTWVQPIRARVMMQTTGIQTPVGIKVKGSDLAEIEQISQQIEAAAARACPARTTCSPSASPRATTPTSASTSSASPQHGVTADEAMLTVRYGIGGDNVVGIKQADSTMIPLAVQYSPEYLDTLDKVRNTPIDDRRRHRGDARPRWPMSRCARCPR